MRLRGKGAFVLALGLAGVTSYGAYSYLDSAGQGAPKPTSVETAPVVVTTREVPARTVITADMIKMAQVAAGDKLGGTASRPEQVAGMVTRQALSPGEQVQTNHLFPDRGESGLSFVVPPGRRAVSVAVNEVVGSGGLIEPGDFVDVVAVIDVTAAQNSQPAQPPNSAASAATASMVAVSQYIVQNVEVLAVAQQVEGMPAEVPLVQRALNTPKTSPSPAADSRPQPEAHTVTLSLTPSEAQKVILAEDKGRIRLALRPYGDQTTESASSEGLITGASGTYILKSDPKPL